MSESSPLQWKWVQAAGIAVGAATTASHASQATSLPPNPKAVHAAAPTALLQQYERMTDLKIEAAEARTDTKFERLIGKIDALGISIKAVADSVSILDVKVGTVDTHARSAKVVIITTMIGTALAVAALAWAGVQIFQGGMGVSAAAFQAGQAAGPHK